MSALSLTGCDESQTAAAGWDPNAPGNIPKPAHFSKPGPPAAVPALARFASFASGPAPAPAAPEAAASDSGRFFDGAAPRTPAPGAAPAAAPAPAAKGLPSDGAITLKNRRFAIDTDGWIADRAARRKIVAHDRTHQNGTALSVGGRAVDPSVVPYIAIPGDFKGARKGDLALVSYQGVGAWAVIADVGPRGRFGEGSVALARRLGINPDGNKGGVSSGVTYTLFPGTRSDASLRSQKDLLDYLAARSAEPRAGLN